MMIRKYLLTFITEFIVLLSGIWVYRLATEIGNEQFSIYAITRRVVSLIQPIMMLGMAVALPRFVASLKPSQKGTSEHYLIAALSIPLMICFMLLISSLIWPEFFSFTFYGVSKYEFMSMPIFVMIAGLIVHTMVYGYNRGKMKINHANIMQLTNMALVPVAAFMVENDIMKIV